MRGRIDCARGLSSTGFPTCAYSQGDIEWFDWASWGDDLYALSYGGEGFWEGFGSLNKEGPI